MVVVHFWCTWMMCFLFWMKSKFMPGIRETFKAAMEYAPRTGGSFSFWSVCMFLKLDIHRCTYMQRTSISITHTTYMQSIASPLVCMQHQQLLTFSRPKTRPVLWSLLLFLSFVRSSVQCSTEAMNDVIFSSQRNVSVVFEISNQEQLAIPWSFVRIFERYNRLWSLHGEHQPRCQFVWEVEWWSWEWLQQMFGWNIHGCWLARWWKC